MTETEQLCQSNLEIQILSKRLYEAGFDTRKFLKLKENKAAYEEDWPNHLYTPEELAGQKTMGICGREGLVLVDTDKPEMEAILRQILPETFEVKSPRRERAQFYLDVINGPVPNRILHLKGEEEGAGEIRAQNEYLVAPGSEIRYKDLKTGEEKTGRYTITKDVPIVRVDCKEFMKVMEPYLGSDEKQRITFEQIREGVPQGTRHAQGIKLAKFLLGIQQLDPETALFTLKNWNRLCKPPMDEADLQRMIKNALGYLEQLPDTKDEITNDKLDKILETTVKYDRNTKLITFHCLVSNYTEEGQQNIGNSGESARGKSYLALELAAYFPKEDVDNRGYVSPMGFFHERSKMIDENGVEIKGSEKPKKDASEAEKTLWKNRWSTAHAQINFSKIILIFLDMPHDQLLKRLRPILSHDQKIIRYSITDKSEKYGLRTKNIEIIGYPTVVFCSTKTVLDDQEKSRLWLLSPGDDQDKLKASTQLIINKESNRFEYEEKIRIDPERLWLKNHIQKIKDADISDVKIPKELADALYQQFLKDHNYLVPRHQRDLKRLIALIKAHALLNFHNRQQTNYMRVGCGVKKLVITTQTDIDAGLELYKTISESNEKGVTPEVLDIYQSIFSTNVTGLTLSDILKKYNEKYQRLISSWRLDKEVLPSLLSAGLITEDHDPGDKRKRIFYPTADTHIVLTVKCPRCGKPIADVHVDTTVKDGVYWHLACYRLWKDQCT